MTQGTGSISLFAIEIAITLLAIAIATLFPAVGRSGFSRIESAFQGLARRRTVAIIVVGLSALVFRLAILPVNPIPHPFIHDEFSYLLAADTFASGRLTNPTHPMWVHFESFHIDQLPTYMSMYPPMQGLALAIGQRLFGHPWFGVWLSCGAMCSAICWMLGGWFSPGWAFFGGMIAVVRLALFSEWIDSYNGGAVPAIAGALVIGAFARLIKIPASKQHQIVLGFIMAAGLAILANSRPWECAWLSAAVVMGAIYQYRKGSFRIPSWRFWLPLVCSLGMVAAAMAYYNFRVFGSPWTLPYQTNRATYAVAPLFVWQDLKPEPVYRHPVIRDFYVNREASIFRRIKSVQGFTVETLRKIGIGVAFFFASALLPALIMLPRIVASGRLRSVVLMAGVFLVGMTFNAYFFPRYAAPATGIIYILMIQAFRHLRQAAAGRLLVRLIPLVICLAAGFRVVAGPLRISLDPTPAMWYGQPPLGTRRAAVEAEMKQKPGRHLMIVRYSPHHDSFDEWVYNDADIDAAKVVWAREMGAGRDDELIRYFHGLDVWLIEPDLNPPRITRYKEQDDH